MSRIYFHSPTETAEVLGAERAHAGALTDRVGCGALDVFHNLDRWRELLNPAHDMARHRTGGEMITWAFWFELALRRDLDVPLLVYSGRPIDSGSLVANTALAVGSDPLRLLARLHGQCELHAYVEGPNRAWLADIIQAGLDSGVMRKELAFQPHPETPRAQWPTREVGWGGVIDLLRARDDEPVVTSYSVTDWFPNEDAADWQPPAGTDLTPTWAAEDPAEWAAFDEADQADWRAGRRSELWGELPAEERWRLAVDGLRRRDATMLLELKPENWEAFRFGHSLTAFDLYGDGWRARVEVALGIGGGR